MIQTPRTDSFAELIDHVSTYFWPHSAVCFHVMAAESLSHSQLFPPLRANMAAGPEPASPPSLFAEPTRARLDVGAVATFSNTRLCCRSPGQGCPLERASEAMSNRFSPRSGLSHTLLASYGMKTKPESNFRVKSRSLPAAVLSFLVRIPV